MRVCRLCHKKVKNNNEKFFKIPNDECKRRKWSQICGIQLTVNDGLCGDHFSCADIIKRHHKVTLNPDALPSALLVRSEENFTFTNFASSGSKGTDLNNCFPEYVHINTCSNNGSQKCRCCTNPSSNFMKLDSIIKSGCSRNKSYKDVLYEMTNLSIPIQHENILPQQICLKCRIQLENAYKFIQQACQVSNDYLNLIEQEYIHEDIKNIEHLRESLIEIAEGQIAKQANEKLKIEPLNVDLSNMDIKEEKVEYDTFPPNIVNIKESEEEKDIHSSEDDEDSDEQESEKNIQTDLSTEPIAICCDICQKIYRNEKFLEIHKRYTHMPEENKLSCPLCSHKTSRTGALKVHIGLVHGHDKVNEFFKRAPDSNKKYTCSVCPRSYRHKDSLRKHSRNKHIIKSPPKEEIAKKVKPLKHKEKQLFLCNYCGQSYNTKSGLKSHALTHTGERPFLCEICNKTFKRLKDLQLHRVIHSDEKPHQCSECGKAFKRADKLKFHMRVHSELRPYKCKECEKTFKYPNVLRTHMHIHTGQTPFTCRTCGETFSLRTSLNNHCLKNGHDK